MADSEELEAAILGRIEQLSKQLDAVQASLERERRTAMRKRIGALQESGVLIAEDASLEQVLAAERTIENPLHLHRDD
jgi:hypothetical protein